MRRSLIIEVVDYISRVLQVRVMTSLVGAYSYLATHKDEYEVK